MKPRIETITQKKLIGHNIEMSLISNKTQKLFSEFMPQKKHITNTLNNDVFEVMIYSSNYFKLFNPTNSFTKWAAIEVNSFIDSPENMQTLTLDPSLYAVFTYKGLSKDFGLFMQSVFTEWLPKSLYILDDRPHFNILGDNYKNNHPESEEEVYIPIKLKA